MKLKIEQRNAGINALKWDYAGLWYDVALPSIIVENVFIVNNISVEANVVDGIGQMEVDEILKHRNKLLFLLHFSFNAFFQTSVVLTVNVLKREMQGLSFNTQICFYLFMYQKYCKRV